MGSPQSKKPIPSAIEKELSELQHSYITNLPKKITHVKDLWRKLTHYSWSDEAFKLLQRLAHGLAGSGKTFGFSDLSNNARKLDEYLLTFVNIHESPSAEERNHIDGLIKALEKSAYSCEAKENVATEPTNFDHFKTANREKTIYVVDDDPHISQYLSAILTNVGYSVRTFTKPRLAYEYMTQQQPDLVIMDVMFPEGNLTGIEVIEDFRATAGKRIPIIFISSRTDLKARVNAVRSGGDAYITKPIDVTRLFEKIDDLISVYDNNKYRVLIVDDDEELSAYYAATLRKVEMDVTVINKPVKVLETLDRFNPDILLMDMYMPDYNGLELASVIRQEDKYIALPIVFLSAEGSKDVHEQAFRLGVDDFLVKPIVGDKLVDTIKKQVKRARKLNLKISKLSKFDCKTALANRQYFLQQLEHALTTHADEQLKPSLIDISIDRLDAIIDRVGLEWLEPLNQQLANIILSNLGELDLATQFSENVYMVLAHQRDSEQTIQLVQKLRDVVHNSNLHLAGQTFHLNSNISITELSDKIKNLHVLLEHAVDLSEQASKNGSNNFVISDRNWDGSGALPQPFGEDSIIDAIENNNFKLAFQPIINLENNNDEKFEVLLRLNHEAGKVILPQHFFPIVKKNNLASQLDRWVIEHAIAALSNNPHARSGTDFFVKISFDSLHDPMLLPRISNSITASGLPGEKRIVFEINEKDLMIDKDTIIEFCNQVQKLKCGISISNYGQSMEDIKIFELLSVDYVKLHGSCLENILVDENKRNRIKELINQALHNKAQIIAGTIEDPATLSVLWDLGARFFQGYFINEPDFSLDYDFTMSVMH